ncbi:MAG: hypothetical protein JWQ11_3266 [Rhizobacter sp.]|nr:hypothetical protein [Rhizobacter sp.]
MKLNLVLAVSLTLSFSSLCASTSSAQSAPPVAGPIRMKYAFSGATETPKYLDQHAVDVGDVPGHQIRVAKLQTLFKADAPAYDGIKVTESLTALNGDYVDGSGHFVLYSVLTMTNGDKIFHRGEALISTTVADDGGRKSSFAQVITITGGTGHFLGIHGTLKVTGATDFKLGTSGNSGEGEYWLDKP